MSDDTLYVAHDAKERLKKLTPLRKFRIPFMILGELEIEATDAEAAECAACAYTIEQLAARGDLQVFEPEPAEVVQ